MVDLERQERRIQRGGETEDRLVIGTSVVEKDWRARVRVHP
jgi:hypothetical protein